MSTTDMQQRFKALLVEDEDVWGRVLSRYLTLRGCEVTWMTDASDAVRFIQESNPDLILLDLKSPKQDGPQLIEAVESLGEDVVAKTAVVTGYPFVALTWARKIRVFDKADLSQLGQWLDVLIGPVATRQS